MNPQELSVRGRRIAKKTSLNEALSAEDLADICDIIEASGRMALRWLKVWIGIIVMLIVGIGAVERILGYSNIELNGVLFVASGIALLPAVLSGDNCRREIESRLKCRSCSRSIKGNQVRRVIQSNECPFCHCPTPLTQGESREGMV